LNDAPAAIEPGHGDPLIGPLDRSWTQGTALLAALFFSSLAHAQLPSNPAGASLTGVERQILLESPPQGFEEPVDPSAYRVVPGDIYALGLWGAVDTLVTVVVGPEGSLVIPSVGIVPVDGLTLAAAQARVAEEVRRVFPRAEVTLSLIRLGTFRVEVTGMVARPGGYAVTGVQKARDAILMAGDILPGGSLRRIEIKSGGKGRTLDFVKWSLHARATENPALIPGMRIHVPPRGATFRLRGPVEGGLEPVFPYARSTAPVDRLPQPLQVSLEWKDGDTVAEAIHRAGGLTPEALSGFVYLWRGEPDSRRALVPEVVRLEPDTLIHVPVLPGDLIDIPYREEWVAVTGAVNRPGKYPFLAGWTARDYINAAAGPSSIGKRSGWSVVREGSEEKGIDPRDPVAPGDVLQVPQSLTHRTSSLLATASTAVALVLSVIAVTR
jgi:protein involved in polysaccharide export with SLBB domain